MKLPIWNSLPPRRRKLLLWFLGLVAAYAGVGFLILPPIVRSVAAKQLSKQLDREVTIAEVRINPFALSTTIRGLLVKDPDGQPFLSWDEVYVNLQISSLFTRAWTFEEIRTSHPFIRVQVNRDRTFNFSDLIAKFSGTNTVAESKPAAPPPVLHIHHLEIIGAAAAVTDLTTREPFKRIIGPLDMTLEDFRTDPDNKNPHTFTGTTDAGERIAWSGFFYLNPLRSQGELTLDRFTINKYAALYQDLVRFQIRDGSIGLHLNYRIEFSATNQSAQVTDAAFALRDFKAGIPDRTNNFIELHHFAVTDASADLESHRASVGKIIVSDASLLVRRDQDQSVNLVEMAKPAESATNAPGGILFLLHSVTNAVALLLQSTNQWTGSVHSLEVTNCSVHLEDLANSRPATLDLTDIRLLAKNISNLPGTNLTADFSLRWNTNGFIKTVTTASLLPPTAEVQLDLDRLDLGSLDAYLEPKLNLFILGSQVGLHGKINLTTPLDALPQVTFHGDANLDDFKTVDGVFAEDLLKWHSLQFNGIEAKLNPESVNIRNILVDRAYARIVIETNQTINLLNALRLTNAPAAATTPVVAASPVREGMTNALLPQISVGAIVITNTAVSFTDRSLAPEVNLGIQQIDGSVSGISTESKQHAVVDLGAKVEGVGPAAITGLINPLNGGLTNTLKISLTNMDLTPVSPYAGKFAGYRIAEGKLNVDLDYNLIGKKLSSQNIITLDRFTFGDQVNSPDATKLPMRLAVAILKDRAGQIVLDVPIEGSTDDPQFRIGKVVTRVIVNLLTKVATSPFSLLGAAFGGGEELSYQDFAPGSATLTADDQKKLDTLLKALHERPGLGVEIAGSVDPDGDREGLQRAAIDQQIRRQLWLKLRKSEQAANPVDEIVIPPAERDSWVKKWYEQAVADKKITPELIAANTNLAVFAAELKPRRVFFNKGATLLMKRDSGKPTPPATTTYQTKLVPAPNAEEALLLATIPVNPGDFEKLAASRAKAVQTYLLQSGQVEASRLFLTASSGFRHDGSRAYLQLR